MRHGNVYPPDRTTVALDRFFTEANLTALRELSLRFVGGQVDAQLGEVYSSQGMTPAAQVVERVAVLMSADPSARRAIRRAASLAAALRAPLMAVTVTTPASAHLSYDRARDLRENLDYAVDLGAQPLQVEAKSVVDGLADAIRTRRITQVVVAHTRRGAVDRLLHPSFASTLLDTVPEVEIHLVGDGPEPPMFSPPARSVR
jgi:two-component system sensor histidine kinase KdpD